MHRPDNRTDRGRDGSAGWGDRRVAHDLRYVQSGGQTDGDFRHPFVAKGERTPPIERVAFWRHGGMSNKQHSTTPTPQRSNHITVGIITISDRASAGDYDDLGGPGLKQAVQKIGWQVLAEAIVPDETTPIQETIRSFGKQGCGLILTTGGTGIGPRDVTPEAIRAIMRAELPGFGEVMRAES